MAARTVPRAGSIYLDTRGDDRALRVTWHQDHGVVVLSMWRDNLCTGTFRLPVEAVPDLIEVLRGGLSEPWPATACG